MKSKAAFALSLVMAIGCVFAETADIVTVKGRGVGEDMTSALKDAYRDAIETAVGLYVDAKQMVKNDELIKDQILTQSNAYIEDYDVIDKKTENGVVKIKILARVKKQELTKKIDGVMPAKTIKLGGELKKLHAVTTTQEKRSDDAVALLSNVLNGVDPLAQLMDVSLASTEVIQLDDSTSGNRIKNRRGWNDGMRVDPNEKEVTYMFKFEINRDRYFKEFLPKLEQVLEQISIEEPKPVAFLVECSDLSSARREVGMNHALESGMATKDDARIMSVASLGSFTKQLRTREFRSFLDGSDGVAVAMVTEGDVDMRAVRGRQFLLDPAAGACIRDWRMGAECQGRFESTAPSYLVSFYRADGKVVAQRTIKPTMRAEDDTRNMMSCESVYWLRNNSVASAMRRRIMETALRKRKNVQLMDSDSSVKTMSPPSVAWVITPYMGTNAKAFYQRFTFKLPKEELPKIDSIKIELVH